MDFNEHTATEAVQNSFSETPDVRLQELLNTLTRHLHAFVREARPSVQEWEQAIEFLTAVGQTCTDTRQEFVLLSDVLGVSMLVETLNEQEGGTESTVLGPFHMVESPPRALGDTIDLVGEAEPCVVSGRVLSTDGTPLPHAEVDVWQCNERGSTTSSSQARNRPATAAGFPRRRRGTVPFPHHRAQPLPDPHGRPGWTAPQSHPAAPLPSGAHSLHRPSPRIHAADHTHLRSGQPLSGLGRRLCSQAGPHRRLRRVRRRGGRRPQWRPGPVPPRRVRSCAERRAGGSLCGRPPCPLAPGQPGGKELLRTSDWRPWSRASPTSRSSVPSATRSMRSRSPATGPCRARLRLSDKVPGGRSPRRALRDPAGRSWNCGCQPGIEHIAAASRASTNSRHAREVNPSRCCGPIIHNLWRNALTLWITSPDQPRRAQLPANSNPQLPQHSPR